jgi:hypothetical protein
VAAHVTGPLEGAASLISTFFDLGEHGYTAEEFFYDGEAASYTLTGPARDDGHWEAVESGHAPFRTRLVTYRPADPAAFNGTVIVEWLNVTAGADAPAEWITAHRHLMRDGYAWVGVSAQRTSIEGGSIFENAGEEAGDDWQRILLPALKASDPARYGTLSHPGDAFSFDIFSQAGALARDGAVLGPLTAQRVLAAGQSQSAIYLVTYVNAVAPTGAPFDGYLIHGRAGSAAPVEGWDGRNTSGSVRLRTDLDQPVLVLQSETDVFGALAALGSRQPDTGRLRLWEVAGAAHADTYMLGAAFVDSGRLPAAELAAMMAPTAEPFGMRLPAPINSGPQHHYVTQAAIAALDRWVRDGTAPAEAPRLEAGDGGTLLAGEHGIARGGVRTGWVDVPVAVLSGLGQDGSGALFGTTRAFGPDEITALYPGGREEYLAAFTTATERAVKEGFLLPEDIEEILGLAAASFPGGTAA